jgi:hypothetical protein
MPEEEIVKDFKIREKRKEKKGKFVFQSYIAKKTTKRVENINLSRVGCNFPNYWQ